MNKQLLLTLLLAMTVLLSVSAISASEVNVTDSYTTNLVDDTSDVSALMKTTTDSSVLSVSSDSNVDNDSSKVSLSSEEVLESENSNTLSTNLDDNNVSSDSEGATHFAAYSDEAKVGATIDVSKTITSKDITKYYKGSAQYTATFLDKNGNVLKNTDVQLTINGKTYTVKTNSKGVASLAIGLYPNTYKMTAVNPKTGYSLTTKIKVLSTIKSSDLTKVYADSKKFTATFLDSEGKALANKDIKFTVNGRTYTQKTDSNGVASLAIGLYKGTYQMTSTNVDGLSNTNTIKVLGSTTTKLTASDYTFLTTDTKTIKVKLINGLGYALDSGKTVSFKVNGKTYTANTNSKGVASLKLPSLSAGTYTVTYSFAGDSYYGSSSATSKVSIVSKTKTPTLTVKSTTTFGRGANTPFEVALTVDGVPLAGKTVTFTVNGKPYDKTTDSNGIASLPIGLAVGKYTISYANKADAELNSVSKSATITVKERAATKITWKSGTSFDEGSQTYKVLLQDSNSKALSGKTVQLTINSKTYSAKTSSSGYATFKVNVPAGSYTVSFTYPATGDNENAPSSGSKKISVLKKDADVDKTTEGYGYWLFGGDMKSVNLNTLASQGTTDIFLNYYAITAHGQSAVESWIASANKLGIRVHIWMQTFYSSGWENPVKNGAVNSNLFKEKINEAKKYAAIKGVAGVHLDYLRYPGTAYLTSGGTEAINSFVKQVTEAIHSVNSNLIVSCAIMPETTSNIYYYGQDYSVISKYMDVVIPMVYKGNYGQSTSWITSTTKWFVDNSKGAKVWTGLQGYVSDDNVAKLSSSAIKKDAQAAIDGNAAGVVIFRWGVTNFVDFNSLSDSSSSTPTGDGISISDIATAANNLKNTIASKGSVPTSVSVAGSSYSTSQFLYMMTKAVEYINAGKTSTKISPVKSDAPSNPSSTARNGDLSLSAYLDLASRVSSFIVNYGQAPNYANSDLGHIQYSSLVDAFSRILAYYKTNSKLPNSVTVYAKVSASNVVSTSPSEEAAAKTISISDIVSGATTLKNYYANNNKLPSTVTAGGVKFTVPEFLYLMSQAIYQLGSSNTKDIEYITGVSAASSPSGDAISANLNKDEYLTVSKTIADNIKSNKKAPNYASTSLGKINYEALVDAFARVVAFYGSNSNELPNYVAIRAQAISSSSQAASSSSSTTAKTVSISDIVSGATTLKNYYASNNKFPSTVTAGGVKFTVPEFLYLMSQAIYQLGSSNTKDIAYIKGVSAPSSPSGDIINSELYKNDYLNVSYNVANYIKSNKIAPNYASSSLGNINYTELVDAFARVVAFYGSNSNELPNYVAIRTPGSSSSSIGSTGSGLNEKCTITDLTAYLKSSTNCQVNNSAIKAIVDSLTSGLTSDYDKAQAIFNYVRDTVSYSFYYDTRYGAVGTLNAKTGNCVDHSHLLIAMYRTAGLAARYVHGTCTFSSGSTYGHVWTQVLIDGNWIVGDATSSRNSFGNVVNWNTNYYSLHGMYSGISF